MEALFDLMIK